MPPRSTRGLRPKILTLPVAGVVPEATVTPNFLYSKVVAERAIGRIGRDGYTVLRTKALHGVEGQRAAIETILGPLQDAIDEAESFERADITVGASPVPERVNVEYLGIETHWHAIHRVGQAVESLCALVAAMEAYRGGAEPDAVTSMLLRHDLDIQSTLQSRRARKLAYWESLGSRPTMDGLIGAGLTRDEARELLTANRTWCVKSMKRFAVVATFYTSAFHQVYAKYRHGYTIVNPTFSPLHVVLNGRMPGSVEEAVDKGFVVMHDDGAGRRVVHIVETGVEAIRVCLDMARFVLDITRSLSMAWLLQLEHPTERTIAFDTFSPALVAKWLDRGLDDVYDLTNRIIPRDFDEPEGS